MKEGLCGRYFAKMKGEGGMEEILERVHEKGGERHAGVVGFMSW